MDVKVSQSHIPVLTPRKPPKSSPTTLSIPSLGLATPSKHLSVSAIPSSSSSSSSGSGGLASFRSFRNLFSTASSKQTSSTSKSTFAGFGSIRRSAHGDRNVSAAQMSRESSGDDSPVLDADDTQPQVGCSRNDVECNGAKTGFETPEPLSSRSSSGSSLHAGREKGPLTVVPTDLSTIIEAENSALSRHIPIVDDSHDDEDVRNILSGRVSPAPGASENRTQTSRNESHASTSQSTALDLSSSDVRTEVLRAMSGKDRTEGWLHGVVVDDAGDDLAADEASAAHRTSGEPDVSFNLGELDPDLAAILSPNRFTESAPVAHAAIGTPRHPVSVGQPERGRTPVSTAPQRESAPPRRSALAGTSLSSSTPSSRRPVSLSTVGPSTPLLPASTRLARSASDRPELSRLGLGPPPVSPSRCVTHMSHSPERPSTAGASSSPPSRFSFSSREDYRTLPRPHTVLDSEPRRPAMSPFLAPTWSGSHVTPGGTVRPSSRYLTRTPPHTYASAPASPTSRPASAASSGTSRWQPSRLTRDGVSEGSQRIGLPWTRERSASAVEYHLTQEHASVLSTLRPRTAKAFAAAGLLDLNKDANDDTQRRPASRFSIPRGSMEDPRSWHAPSRVAFSETGSSTSWSRRSASRSRRESVSHESSGLPTDGKSTPRTMYSGASTAPTSVTASSSAHLQSELQSLQDRHSIETGALLSALADSQRTSRVLREENTQLRDRLQETEDKLAAALEEIERLRYSAQTKRVPTVSRLDRPHRVSTSPDRTVRTPYLRLPARRQQTVDTSAELPSSPEPAVPLPKTPTDRDAFLDVRQKRLSATSSLFPVLPSNMSMLMHEEGIAPELCGALSSSHGSPRTPPMTLKELNSAQTQTPGNISPTTENFSMTTGSPASLNLRPEHELHLQDMSEFDLSSDYDAEDGYR
ncbi:uncharacterized protein LAESUDRAFT_750811 [Laetiporus sulphureus 93-53]|uniref:Uncharacterized protein n=1 Tax=Laetiporus sulphureus 93-53 TaxID=1314785 RepID=A0A165DLK1_9APHY|nr:uncharacterized protein LAESUDRAFT_750811 [Laetiporus sulphureus 93-53]KZT05151.1 hypothetical protein LAESUDRAFT_750811 [Laetiporus sulphureus 93-53]